MTSVILVVAIIVLGGYIMIRHRRLKSTTGK